MANKRIFILLFCVLAIVSSAFAQEAQEPVKPKNVILMIGDGMGVAHITAARYELGELAFERFKNIGLSLTKCLDRPVTDSAAGGTALATGHRTNYTMVAMNPDGSELKTLLEYAHEAGKATGITVTCLMPHATPAAFTAHNKSRYNLNEIAEQQVANRVVDVMIGGGSNYFMPQNFPKSKRTDDKNLINHLRNRMPVLFSMNELRAFNGRRVAAFLAKEHIPLAVKRDYTLGEMTEIAIKSLNKNDNGFVLMVEASHIDTLCHNNDQRKLIGEMNDFNTAINAALDFAQKDGNTLVVVTADHETGGLTLPNKFFNDGKVTDAAFSSNSHTGCMVPVFAFGTNSELFTGIHKNCEIGQLLIDQIK